MATDVGLQVQVPPLGEPERVIVAPTHTLVGPEIVVTAPAKTGSSNAKNKE